MGARTDAARTEVLVRRGELLGEVQRLEAAGRSAVDIPAKVRRAPAKTAGLAFGTAFIALGGPRRLFGRARRAVRGPQAELPKSLLPNEIEKTLRSMGTDGDRVRGTLEREFASYLSERTEVRRSQSSRELVIAVLNNLLRPISLRVGWSLAGRLVSPDPGGFQDALQQDSPTGNDIGPRFAAGSRRGAPDSQVVARRPAHGHAPATFGGPSSPFPRILHARLAAGEWRNGRRAGLRSRCRVSGVGVRVPSCPPREGASAPAGCEIEMTP